MFGKPNCSLRPTSTTPSPCSSAHAASQQEPQPGTPEKLRKELLEKLEKWASSCGGAPKLRGKAQLGGRHLQEGQVGGLHDLWKHAARPARTTGPRSSWSLLSATEMARAWLATLLKERRPKTTMTLWRRPESIIIVTDASAHKCGGLLLVRATAQATWTILKAYEYAVEQEDADLLGFQYRSHKGQGFLEALAVFLALRDGAN